jgi:beta-glucosidase/6-phospho-beta-glucosidase/beta-galactosidase
LLLALVVLLAASLGTAGCEEEPAPQTGRFPDGFLWGTAVAGFQVDMGCPTLDASRCVDTRSDWYVWVTTQSLIDDPATHLSGDPVSVGPGHWELFEQDFDLAQQELGLNAFRMSIEWSRVFPQSTVGIEDPVAVAAAADATAVAHYRDMLTALRDRGIEPLVTLHHYTLPVWLHDAVGCHFDLQSCSPRGWLDRERLVGEIAKYSGFVAAELGDLVDRWATQNEPFAVVLAGYLQPGPDRTNPPGVGLAFEEVKAVSFAMIEAHGRMYDAVKAADTTDADGDGEAASVGLVFAVAPAHAQDPEDPEDVAAVENVNYLYNWAFLDAVVLGEVDEELDGTQRTREDLVGRMDWLGINYYAVTEVEGTPYPTLRDLSPLTTFNPATLTINYDDPSGIYEALTLVQARYPGLPLYITENGTPHTDDGQTQRRYLVEHLSWVSQAWRDGVDVRGYFYWSFMDNYEWNHGMGMRFGLYGVDTGDPAKPRTPRPAVEDYARIIEANAIPQDLRRELEIP